LAAQVVQVFDVKLIFLLLHVLCKLTIFLTKRLSDDVIHLMKILLLMVVVSRFHYCLLFSSLNLFFKPYICFTAKDIFTESDNRKIIYFDSLSILSIYFCNFPVYFLTLLSTN